MYRPNVIYRGPDGATRSVTNELTAKFGAPARPYEFVTGWKDPGNVSGHNPDSSGITHGVDIFLTWAQNRWAADHLAARGRAGDKRVFYVIYAGQIASAATGYQFAGSGWEHWDHPHLSVWDGYWGGDCTLPASIYNDTSSWGIAGTTTQGDKPSPISPSTEEGFFMALSDKEQRELLALARQIAKYADTKISAVAGKVWGTPVVGRPGGPVSALQELADVKTKVLGLEPVITSIAEQTDPARIAEMIPADIAAQVMAALSAKLGEAAK